MSPTLIPAARAARDDAIDAALRRLDPADGRVDPERARTLLAAVLATDPGAPAPAAVTRPEQRRVPARRLVLAGGAVAALAATFVLLPSPAGGDRAFATWTAAPSGLTAEGAADAAADCRAALSEGAADDVVDATAALDAAVPAVAEQRGAWTTVLLAGDAGFSGLCVTDTSADPSGSARIGSVGTPTGFVEPGARELVASDLGVGTVHDADVSLVAGYAGADVAGVVHRSPTHGDVTATVSHGRFALWFPGGELWDASSDGVEVEVTYTDGTTATAVLTL